MKEENYDKIQRLMRERRTLQAMLSCWESDRKKGITSWMCVCLGSYSYEAWACNTEEAAEIHGGVVKVLEARLKDIEQQLKDL